MRWLPNTKDEPQEENEDKNSKSTIESRFRESEQLDLFPEPDKRMLERVLEFIKHIQSK